MWVTVWWPWQGSLGGGTMGSSAAAARLPCELCDRLILVSGFRQHMESHGIRLTRVGREGGQVK